MFNKDTAGALKWNSNIVPAAFSFVPSFLEFSQAKSSCGIQLFHETCP